VIRHLAAHPDPPGSFYDQPILRSSADRIQAIDSGWFNLRIDGPGHQQLGPRFLSQFSSFVQSIVIP